MIHAHVTRLAWFGHCYPEGFVCPNLDPQRTDRNVENFGSASAVSNIVYQCLANEFTLDLRNRVTDKLLGNLNLSRGESTKQPHFWRLL